MQKVIIAPTAVTLALLAGGLSACGEEVLENGGVGGGPTTGSTSIATGQGGATSASTGSGPVVCPAPQMLPFTDLEQDECQLLDRSSCPEPGTGCVAQTDGTTTCVFDGGLKDVREFCSDDAECKAGLLCIAGKCSQPCCRDTGDPCGSGECAVDVDVANGNFIYYCLYPDLCTPFGEPCPAGQNCNIRFNTTSDAICAEPGPDAGTEGEDCGFINDCVDGLTCDTPGPVDVCRYVCKTDGSSTTPGQGGCPAAQTCVAIQGFDNIGVCRP
jgi:hypothetical protein